MSVLRRESGIMSCTGGRAGPRALRLSLIFLITMEISSLIMV